MNRTFRTEPENTPTDWQQLFEAALLEPDSAAATERLQTAKDAIMDRIEDCFEVASQTERRLLLTALNAISELERLSKPEGIRSSVSTRTLGHAA